MFFHLVGDGVRSGVAVSGLESADAPSCMHFKRNPNVGTATASMLCHCAPLLEDLEGVLDEDQATL